MKNDIIKEECESNERLKIEGIEHLEEDYKRYKGLVVYFAFISGMMALNSLLCSLNSSKVVQLGTYTNLIYFFINAKLGMNNYDKMVKTSEAIENIKTKRNYK